MRFIPRVVGSREDISSSREDQKEQGNCMPSSCTYNIGTFVSEGTVAVDFIVRLIILCISLVI